jgi:hypothetical protein
MPGVDVIEAPFRSAVDRRSAADRAHIGDIVGAMGTVASHDVGPHRSLRRRLVTLAAVMGPGLIVMAGDNDAGGISLYAQAGQNHGLRLAWIVVLLAPVLLLRASRHRGRCARRARRRGRRDVRRVPAPRVGARVSGRRHRRHRAEDGERVDGGGGVRGRAVQRLDPRRGGGHTRERLCDRGLRRAQAPAAPQAGTPRCSTAPTPRAYRSAPQSS